MKNKNNYRLLLLTLIGTCLFSCQDTIENVPQATPNLSEVLADESDGEIVLGKKLDNPYTVKNMRKALKNLKEKQQKTAKKYAGETFNEGFEIEITDYYVKFWIENNAQKELLLADSLNLSIVPLDVEIEQEGDYFVDENTEIEQGQWLYTSVVKDYQFHSEVTHEIIEELFLIEESGLEEDEGDEKEDASTTTTIAGKSTISKRFLYDLEDEALRISGNYTDLENDKTIDNISARRRKRKPQGYIKVYNTVSRRLDPVVGVKVKTRRWFKWAKGWTNSQGFYRVNRGYRRNVRYTVVFKNTKGFKIWPSTISISSARYRAGKHSKYGHNITFNTNSVGWRWATVNNATVKYLDYCTQFGIGKPHSNLRIVANGKSGGGATPMLRHVRGYLGFTSNSKLLTFLGKMTISIPANYIWIVYRFVLPDIIIKANASQGTDGVFSTTFHELGHASHFRKVGSSYWIKYINYIITYGKSSNPYGDGHGKNAGTCALGEAWANHFGYILTLKEFGNNNRIISSSGFENFHTIKRPSNISINRLGRPIYRWEGWIPSGVMLDITDTNRDLVREGYFDDVSGYTTKNVFDALDSGVESPQKFRDRLLSENGNKDAYDLKELFKAYYWE